MASKYKKRSDGRYLVQIPIGYNENGKPKYKNIYARTQQELEKKEREFRQNLEKGIIIDDSGLTVETWSKRWLELYKTNLEHYTKETYKSVIDVHIIPSIGHIKLKNLKTFHIQEMINSKASEGLTRTLGKIRATLGQIIKQAIINEYIYKDVMIGVQFPKVQRKEKRPLSDTEIQCVNDADISLKERAFILMLIYTGLRRGEILALTRNDVNLKSKTVTVNKAVYFNRNEAVLKNTPKSQAGNREIPIPDFLVEILSEYQKGISGIVFFPSARSSSLMSRSSFFAFWYKAIRKIEEQSNKKTAVFNADKKITPHACRHTYASVLYKANVDIKSAQYLLGHSSIRVTMDIYTHLGDEQIVAAKDKINLYINPKNSKEVSGSNK